MTSPTVYFLPLKAHSKFPLGEMVITTNAARKISGEAVADGLRRHAECDWGELCPEDVESNEYALKHGERLFSAYGQGEGRFWIITTACKNITNLWPRRTGLTGDRSIASHVREDEAAAA